eukprot:UN02419
MELHAVPITSQLQFTHNFHIHFFFPFYLLLLPISLALLLSQDLFFDTTSTIPF